MFDRAAHSSKLFLLRTWVFNLPFSVPSGLPPATTQSLCQTPARPFYQVAVVLVPREKLTTVHWSVMSRLHATEMKVVFSNARKHYPGNSVEQRINGALTGK